MGQSITIVDYDAGNLRSVQRACQAVGLEAAITADPEEILKSDRVIFPGVGTAESAMVTLRARGIDQALTDFVQRGQPLLGICLGLQVLLDHTEEGDRSCLGLIPGRCHRFGFSDPSFKIPQIGWNAANRTSDHALLASVPDGTEFYFVHSYYAVPDDEVHVLAETTYGDRTFASVIGRDNVFATQFHLEKSGRFGLALLSAFRHWEGG